MGLPPLQQKQTLPEADAALGPTTVNSKSGGGGGSVTGGAQEWIPLSSRDTTSSFGGAGGERGDLPVEEWLAEAQTLQNFLEQGSGK